MSASRDDLDRALSVAYDEIDKLKTEIERLKGESSPISELEILRAANKQLEEFRDKVVEERLKGGQGEPVLWFKRLFGAECKSDGRTYDVMFCAIPGYAPLFASRPAPVAVVLPERKREDAYDESQSVITYHAECGWNLYDDELKRLNPWLLDKVKELNQ